MSLIMGFVCFLIELLTLMLFCLVAGYVFAVGKPKSGMNLDFTFFALMCGLVLFIL